MKRLISILLILVLCLALLPGQAFAVTFITRVDLVMDLPVAGQTPRQNCSILSNGYTIHAIDWDEVAGRGFLEAGEKFQEGCTYEATVWVEAASGYEFSYMDSKTPAITAYVNGQEVSVTKAYEYNAWAMVCLTVKFYNIPAKGWIKNVNLSVPAPAAGEKPSYAQITGTGYGTANVYFGDTTNEDMQNGIAWYTLEQDVLKPGQDTFGENTAYIFHCLVFPAEGYRIVEKATVWVNGKEAEAQLDYDTFLAVTYTFPTTGKVPPTHTHTPSAWRTTGIYHYKVCTACGDMLDQEDHLGGTATCSAKGKCSVCGYAYLEENENHTPDTSKWIAKGDGYHYHACKLCGAHCDTEDHRWSPTYLYKDKNGHAWICADCKGISAIEKHIAGPAGTPGAAEVCRDCGYIMTPEKDHQHQLTKVPQTPATCTAEGNIEYYTCSGCSDRFTDAAGANLIPETMSVGVGALGHTPSEVWGMDDTYHWRVCTTCNQVLEETKLVHDLQSDKCVTCGYEADTPVTEATEPTPTTPAAVTPVEEKGGIPWWVWVLVAVGCGGIGVVTAVLLVKKKE